MFITRMVMYIAPIFVVKTVSTFMNNDFAKIIPIFHDVVVGVDEDHFFFANALAFRIRI
jgi:hypothetical protein